MDRRSDPETEDGQYEDRLQKALGLIVRSYNNISPEELYKEAILCFDSLIDISYNTETVKDFALKHETDLKYLVDGANFVISRMHFNPENNFYITLGISQRASQEEVRERWKRLMLLYHPDRLPEGEDLVSERAKKVNEAYNTLKDSSRRMAYDKKLRELEFQSNTAYNQPPQSHSVNTSSKSSRRMARPLSDVRFRLPANLPKFLVGLYIFAALIFIGFIYFQEGSSNLEAELFSKKQPSSTSASSAIRQADGTEADTSTLKNIWPEKGFKKTGEQKIGSVPGAIPESPESYRRIRQKENTKEVRNPLNDEKTRLSSPAFSGPAYEVAITSDRKEEAKTVDRRGKDDLLKKQGNYGGSGPDEHKIARQPDTGNKAVHNPEASLASVRGKEDITKAEVEDFIRRYSVAYEKRDLNTFMSLFSKSAMDNRNKDYEAIRNSYSITFSQKIKYYRLDTLEIRTEGQYAFVTGLYDIMRQTFSENRAVRYKGKIHWKLVREDNLLKIMRADYDN